MRIYATTLWLNANQGLTPVFSVIQRWVTGAERRNARVRSESVPRGKQRTALPSDDIDVTAAGSRQLPSGAFLEVAHISGDGEASMHAIRYSHRDGVERGRNWITEIGTRVLPGGAEIELSVYLYTDDLSAGVGAPVIATRPMLVRDLLQRCEPTTRTAGLVQLALTVQNANDIAELAHRPGRAHPLVILSARSDGTYAVDPAMLQDQLGGLATLVVIPPAEDTWAIQSRLGQGLTPYGGAVAILFPARLGPYATPVPVRRLLPTDLETEDKSGRAAAAKVFVAVTERTNLVNAKRHISPETVREARTRRLLARRMRDDATGEELRAIIAELEQEAILMQETIASKDREIAQTELEFYSIGDDRDEARRELHDANSQLEALRAQLSAARDGRGELREGMENSRAALDRLVAGAPTLEDCLHLLEFLYSDRVCILPSAYSAARASAGFREGAKLWALLQTLVGPYWEALAAGKSDDEARKVFPTARFAARDKANLSKNGTRRRTFTYKGRSVVMEPHLKVGNTGGSADTTHRVHFEWDAGDKLIVIGHSGEHIPF